MSMQQDQLMSSCSLQMLLEPQVSGRVVVLMGSTSDVAHCEKIKKACVSYGISCTLRVTSAHKGPDETLRIKAEYEGEHQVCRQRCPGFQTDRCFVVEKLLF